MTEGTRKPPPQRRETREIAEISGACERQHLLQVLRSAIAKGNERIAAAVLSDIAEMALVRLSDIPPPAAGAVWRWDEADGPDGMGALILAAEAAKADRLTAVRRKAARWLPAAQLLRAVVSAKRQRRKAAPWGMVEDQLKTWLLLVDRADAKRGRKTGDLLGENLAGHNRERAETAGERAAKAQRLAADIWSRRPDLTRNAVAIMVAPEVGLSAERVRKLIHKP